MDNTSLWLLLSLLLLMLILSAFFSASETALMLLNRHRLRFLAGQGHRGAQRAQRLLDRPDRLISIILLGNSFANILASSLSTVIAIQLWGEGSIAIAAIILTILVLIFSEVTPKTLAALHPEAIAFPAAYIYEPLLLLLYPIVWVVNGIANTILKCFGVTKGTGGVHSISKEELRIVVQEAGTIIPVHSQNMLLGILDLERAMVEDIMIPRHEVDGIDLSSPIEETVALIRTTPYSTILMYDGGMDNVVGIFHARDAMHALLDGNLTRELLKAISRTPYFVPAGTALYTQLLNFQHTKNRTGLVVDEYGDFLGLITLSDLLEEVVGEFTTDPADADKLLYPQQDGEVLIDCSITVRDLNQHLGWNLPTNGPKTLNGLILEYLETIPDPGTSMVLHGYHLETVHTTDNTVKTVRYKKRARIITS